MLLYALEKIGYTFSSRHRFLYIHVNSPLQRSSSVSFAMRRALKSPAPQRRPNTSPFVHERRTSIQNAKLMHTQNDRPQQNSSLQQCSRARPIKNPLGIGIASTSGALPFYSSLLQNCHVVMLIPQIQDFIDKCFLQFPSIQPSNCCFATISFRPETWNIDCNSSLQLDVQPKIPPTGRN